MCFATLRIHFDNFKLSLVALAFQVRQSNQETDIQSEPRHGRKDFITIIRISYESESETVRATL